MLLHHGREQGARAMLLNAMVAWAGGKGLGGGGGGEVGGGGAGRKGLRGGMGVAQHWPL